MPGDVSATPTVYNGVVYVPDWGGQFTAVDASNGNVIWQDDLGTLLGKAAGSVVSRTGPAISGNTVYISTQQGALLLSINATSGALNWSTPIDVYGNQYATGTQSPVVFQGVVYAGVSSSEEAAVAFGAPCCTFRGNFSAFAANTGKRMWSVTTIGDISWNAGYRGVGVWGSTPVIDQARGLVYITTGNDYTAPSVVQKCQLRWEQKIQTNPNLPYTCEDAYTDNHVDSVMALNMSTGAIVWSHRLQLYDAWNVACIFAINQTAAQACPAAVGPDYDFGQGAMLIKNTAVGDVLVAGQKSGWLWGLDPSNGNIRWSNQAGPGGTLGGLEWGSSTDGSRVYYAVSNSSGTPFTLTNPAPGSASSTSGGLWGAVDVVTGKTIWQQADPNGYMDVGAVSNANGVVYASSFGPAASTGASSGNGTMVALNAATGAILRQFPAAGSVNSGAAIANGTVYWGSGYANLGLGFPGNTLYALQP